LHEGERTVFGNRPWIKDQKIGMWKYDAQVIKAGSEYTMEPYIFHATRPLDDCRVATIMKKLDEGRTGAHSLCEVGVEPDVDFDRKQWSQERLWEIVVEVLGGKNAAAIVE
jgi:hypothetical protein